MEEENVARGGKGEGRMRVGKRNRRRRTVALKQGLLVVIANSLEQTFLDGIPPAG